VTLISIIVLLIPSASSRKEILLFILHLMCQPRFPSQLSPLVSPICLKIRLRKRPFVPKTVSPSPFFVTYTAARVSLVSPFVFFVMILFFHRRTLPRSSLQMLLCVVPNVRDDPPFFFFFKILSDFPRSFQC